jgi:hypothetical protein
MKDCLPIGQIPFPITIESIKLNGISMHLIFWTIIISRLFFAGWEITIIIILTEYLISLFLKEFLQARIYPSIGIDDIDVGDVIIVCRGGAGGQAADWAELFMYHISSLLYTQSIYGHVGQVFRDSDGDIKVADVRYNKKHQDANKHFIDSVPEFIKNYEGVHYVVRRSLTDEQKRNLTDAVRLVSERTGHCTDCFNPFRLFETPSKDATADEIIRFGEKHGLGCAENVNMMQRIAGISQIDDRFVLPHHFARNQEIFLLKNTHV